jgi:very-short-patch-repair endonuclease
MNLEQYIDNVNQKFKAGNATEHTFRGILEQLIESIVPTIRATNEPKRQSCGAPDYILTKKDIPVGFIEAKDIGDKDLEGAKKTGNKEQFDRYKASLNNLIFTDYLDFHLYRDGQFVTKIAIGETSPNPSKGGALEIKPLTENFERFENLIKDFCTHIGQTIKSSKKLAEMMAGKARLLSDVIEKALTSDENNSEDSTLKDQMNAFKQILIHDITPKGFADVYAQTIAYGMFAARSHDPSLETFSRQEAYELIPKSNPFLKKLFGYIAGLEVDDRIKWIVDDLVNIFLACNVDEILKNYGKSTKMEDPIIHFYETFLSEYDPKLRKARGVWYTPAPVVNFIVRAVDDILKTEFDLPQGLADTSKTKIDLPNPSKGGTYKVEVHKVQILDPATGTGTFLAEVIKLIHKKFEGQQGIWSNYVETHLLPRLNGFELLMASYAMAHLKLDLLLAETGYKPTKDQRFKVYLTNSLEEYHPDTGTLFANWLSTEANEANYIKRDTPVMCVIGNPPYSGESANKGEWIMSLMEDYKKEPGGKENLKERNPKWINDDYVKFLRYGQHFIEKNGSGVLAFINPHGYLDNPTFRGMRWNLLKTYDKIYTIDLHGNSKKKETAPDGSTDQNVFDIMQGVSINVFIKTGKKKANELGQVFHFDLYGKREMKYDFLNENSIKTIAYKELPNIAPNYFFVSKDFDVQEEYNKGIKITELFTLNNVGIVTARDGFTIHKTKPELQKTIEEFLILDDETARSRFDLGKDVRDWQVNFAKTDLQNNYPNKGAIVNISYRPFDIRWTFYTGNSKGFHCYPRTEVMQHFLKGENIGIVFKIGNAEINSASIMITKNIIDFRSWSRPGMQGGDYVAPLYLYPETNTQQTIGQHSPPLEGLGEVRTPNLNAEIVKQIAEKLGLTFTNEKTPPNLPNGEEFSPSFGGVGEVKKERLSQPGYITANPKNYRLIKEMRDNLKKNPTEAEMVMWEYLRNKKTGYKIRRQHIIDDFITDFVCLSKKVVIEIDGKIHLQQKEYDELRTARLEELSYEVIRFTNEEVFSNPELVAKKVKEKLDSKLDIQSDNEPNSPTLEGLRDIFAPIDILDYIYAVLHSPTYREKYKEFLKIDFPRVPYPKDKDTFWQLVKLGGELRQIHLLESPTVEKYITQYPIDGDNMVIKPRFAPSPLGRAGVGSVYINDTQYFDNVPEIAWNFYIGGYQPAQKWLKDRKDRKLEFDDILHYQRIIVALSETDRLMKEIDKIEIE